MEEGTIAFANEPVITIQGLITLLSLIETPILNLLNYPSLIATNARRLAIAAHPSTVVEFGLRRAQGPDGAMRGSL